MLAHKIDGNCNNCGSTEVYYSHTRDSSICKVYGNCENCGKDFGRIGTITDPESADIESKAEEKARKFFK